MSGPTQENKVERVARVPKFWRTQSLPAQRRFGSTIIEDVSVSALFCEYEIAALPQKLQP
jgi:hypothetical protein